MLFECAKVTAVSDHKLSVRSIRTSACERCARGQGCGGGIIGKLAFRGQPTLNLSVTNASSYKVGDSVELSVEASRVMTIAACIYLLPLTALLVGAVVGQMLFGTNSGAVITAVLSLASSFVALRYRLGRMIERSLRPAIHSLKSESVPEKSL